MSRVIDYVKYYTHKAGIDSDNFAEWGFGIYGKLLTNGIESLENWNALHGDKLLLTPSDDMEESMKKMIEIYKAEHPNE